MSREIDLVNQATDFQCQDVEIKKMLHALDQSSLFPIPDGDLCIVFVNTKQCCQIHQQHFHDPSPTDVMTFPGDPEDEHAGDIIICLEYAVDAAVEYHQPFADEVTLYIIHGWLHLAGFRDKTEAEQQQMRAAEQALMNYIRSGAGIPKLSITRSNISTSNFQ